ncbi:hypothetical protein CMI37_09125 [Candidatus Pacearchaeota archaeon]|nr:hypothetical protein [Candidatus Pacearchaeota archaeon]|tara:strand:+ start:795 stop:1301 length:507 start_codon:yes stop_codon:yes gene_type:complete
MSIIGDALDKILDMEGGFVDRLNDYGGPTNYGITIPALEAYTGRPATLKDIKKMKPEVAKAIYTQNYFTKPGIHHLPESLWAHMLDMSVHHGPRKAIKILQKVLNIESDGIIGPVTIEASYDNNSSVINHRLAIRRIEFMARVVKRNRTQAVFILGWVRRAMYYLPQP